MSGDIIQFERRLFAGIDVGQVNDATALAVVERHRPVVVAHGHLFEWEIKQARKEAADMPVRLDLRHLERIPLGTSYPRQVEIIMARLRHPALRGARTYIDATGVGRPVLQSLKRQGARNLHGITITGAQSEAKRTSDGWNVGKAELVNGVNIAMQVGRLRFGRLPHVEQLEHELKEFRSRQNPTTGHTTFNAREGQHDDLVLALSYAVFGASRPEPVTHLDMRFVA